MPVPIVKELINQMGLKGIFSPFFWILFRLISYRLIYMKEEEEGRRKKQ